MANNVKDDGRTACAVKLNALGNPYVQNNYIQEVGAGALSGALKVEVALTYIRHKGCPT